MGVTGLWSVVSPTARPTKLETLNRKRLAVDASIWIYQFLKAVRDKEGNALRNSHVVGFFRRICKLLYIGVLPVFVFDGGAPSLKRETIQKRKRRREGRREDAVRTAGKLLAVQVARVAEEEEKRRREVNSRRRDEIDENDIIPEGEELVYVDELGMNRQEREKERGAKFKRKDQYHLPDLDISIEAMGAPNDPRIMSQAELEEYARQFHSGEDVNLYDFSKIDFESPFFLSLPAGDRYNILNAARLRSRLRMGYSKEQLDGMFPDRMAFSRFQIERVKERNELTQRLMHINGMNEEWDQGGRIAGEKGKEYILVKNEGVEGGWALGVVSNKQGTKIDDAIDVDEVEGSGDDDAKIEEEDDGDFEDVAIEGLNRLPKSLRKKKKDLVDIDYDISYEQAADAIARKRKAVYDARKIAASSKPVRAIQATNVQPRIQIPSSNAEDNLFVAQDQDEEDEDLFEDVPIDVPREDDDEELQQAIAMSLEVSEEASGGFVVEKPTSGGLSSPDSDDDDMDLAAALAESRKSKYQSKTNVRDKTAVPQTPEHTFSGPLPFESLNLGQSLLGKKKSDRIEQEMSGGFDKDGGDDAFREPKKAQPLPSWFQASSGADFKQKGNADDLDDHVTYGKEDVDRRETLMRRQTREVIDLEAEESEGGDMESKPDEEMYYGDADDEDQNKDHSNLVADQNSSEIEVSHSVDDIELVEKEKAAKEREDRYRIAREIAAENENPEPSETQQTPDGHVVDLAQATTLIPREIVDSVSNHQTSQKANPPLASDADEDVEWSESEHEESEWQNAKIFSADQTSVVGLEGLPDDKSDAGESEQETFEDVPMESIHHATNLAQPRDDDISGLSIHDNEADQHQSPNGGQMAGDDFDYLSESDEELMRQLALEAEGHAEFASSLNQLKTPAEAARDYETELKQLRNQQKKDRRDADEVTQVMIQECQALLGLFGLPYITAPMEAEAQCAELVHLGLVDGIVTDDSDIFLFGGTRIYKNMFNAAKFVECYLAQDLEKEYDLDRKKLIRFAHLLGSDYTEGIPGIGPVSALEIISDFDDLEEFRDWCGKVQLGRPKDLENQLTTAFRRKFKKTVQKKLLLPSVFPDLRVDHAYLNPEVDSTPEQFQWGVPDLEKLRSFLMATVGWGPDRTDEILVPVIRDMNRRVQEGTQANITRFFAGGVGVGAGTTEGAAPRNRTGKESGRMKNAYQRLRGEARKKRVEADESATGNEVEIALAGSVAVDEKEQSVNRAKRKSPLPALPTSDQSEESESPTKSTKLRTKKRRT